MNLLCLVGALIGIACAHEGSGISRNFIAGILGLCATVVSIFCFKRAMECAVSLRAQHGKNAVLIYGGAAIALSLSAGYFFVSM